MIVGFARLGDRAAFEELVRPRKSSTRNLMRRLCGDHSLADDPAQQVFLKVWQGIRRLRETRVFGAWLRRLSVTTWLEYLRKQDPLRNARESATPRSRNSCNGPWAP